MPTEPPNPQQFASGHLQARRVLVVDDNRDSADTLAMLLRVNGHDARTAYDGEQAIDAAAALQPDVVLLDIGMPKLNGYEAAQRIRQKPWGKNVVLIALTGWGQEDHRRKTKEAGFHGHLIKPVEFTVLMNMLESHVSLAAGDARPIVLPR